LLLHSLDNNGYGNGRTPSPRRESAGDARGDAEYHAPPPREEGRGGGGGGYGGGGRGGGEEFSVNPGNNLHIRGLDTRTKETDLEDIFGKFGQIEKVQIMRDPHTRDSRGFGFVTFERNEDAEAAMAQLNATTLDGRVLTVEKARRARARTPTPGAYRGPPKREDVRGGPPRRDDRYEDRRGPPRGRYDAPGGSFAAPMRDDRRNDRYDDRRYDRRDAYDSRGGSDRRGGGDRGYDDRRDGARREAYDDRREPYDDRRAGGDDRKRDYPPRAAY